MSDQHSHDQGAVDEPSRDSRTQPTREAKHYALQNERIDMDSNRLIRADDGAITMIDRFGKLIYERSKNPEDIAAYTVATHISSTHTTPVLRARQSTQSSAYLLGHGHGGSPQTGASRFIHASPLRDEALEIPETPAGLLLDRLPTLSLNTPLEARPTPPRALATPTRRPRHETQLDAPMSTSQFSYDERFEGQIGAQSLSEACGPSPELGSSPHSFSRFVNLDPAPGTASAGTNPSFHHRGSAPDTPSYLASHFSTSSLTKTDVQPGGILSPPRLTFPTVSNDLEPINLQSTTSAHSSQISRPVSSQTRVGVQEDAERDSAGNSPHRAVSRGGMASGEHGRANDESGSD